MFDNLCFRFLFIQTVRKRFVDEKKKKSVMMGNMNSNDDEDYIQINPKLSVTVSLGLNLLELIQHTDIMMSLMLDNCSPFL
jgi:hypothetical protein